MSDPIDRPGFHPNLGREPNPETIARIEELADEYRRREVAMVAAYDQLGIAVREAKAAGHSYSQLARATGMAVSTIQRMVDRRGGSP